MAPDAGGMDDELITERRRVAFPQAFGHLRLTGTVARHAAFASCLTEYCRQHELRLRRVFMDRDAPTAARSPAFVGLLDALELADSYGTVVPAFSHLGPRRVATDRQRRTTPGSRLIVVRSTRRATDPVPSLRANPGLLRQEGRDVHS